MDHSSSNLPCTETTTLICEICGRPSTNGSVMASVCDDCAGPPLPTPVELEIMHRQALRERRLPTFGVHARLYPDPPFDPAQLPRASFFASLPDTVDCGVVEHRGPNGALRLMVAGLVAMAALVGCSFLYIAAQKVY